MLNLRTGRLKMLQELNVLSSYNYTLTYLIKIDNNELFEGENVSYVYGEINVNELFKLNYDH